jgi:hypothetical protein
MVTSFAKPATCGDACRWSGNGSKMLLQNGTGYITGTDKL